MASLAIFIVEKVPQSLKGELTRWMIEPRTGVFVGKLSATVRLKLWEKIIKNMRHDGCTMIYSKNNEQGFVVTNFGDTSRDIVDMEGLYLVKVSNQP
jgi:CRISPR-associated protein Cas2